MRSAPTTQKAERGEAGQAGRNFTPSNALEQPDFQPRQMQQLSLPTIAPPPFAPRWPGIHTLDHAALELFLAGEFLTVERFRQLTDSTRLPAVVDRLKKLGWPLQDDTVPEPSRRCRRRHVSVWHLPKKYSAMRQGRAA